MVKTFPIRLVDAFDTEKRALWEAEINSIERKCTGHQFIPSLTIVAGVDAMVALVAIAKINKLSQQLQSVTDEEWEKAERIAVGGSNPRLLR